MKSQRGFILFGVFVFSLVFAGVYATAKHQNEQQQKNPTQSEKKG